MISSLLCLLLLAAPGGGTTRINRPWLGMALILRADPKGGKFIFVAQVPASTPAFQAGMARGDLITAIDNHPIAFGDDLELLEYVARLRQGQTVRFQLVRNGRPLSLSLKVGVLPPENEDLWQRSLEHARAARKQAAAKKRVR